MFLTLFLLKVFFLLSLITLSAYYFSSEKFNSTKSPSLHISFFSSPLRLTMYWYCKEKLLIDQYTGVKRVIVVSPYPEQRQNLVVHNGWYSFCRDQLVANQKGYTATFLQAWTLFFSNFMTLAILPMDVVLVCFPSGQYLNFRRYPVMKRTCKLIKQKKKVN